MNGVRYFGTYFVGTFRSVLLNVSTKNMNIYGLNGFLAIKSF